MGPKTPEVQIAGNITLLKNSLTESASKAEITVRSDNLGANTWQEMLMATQADGRERGLIVYRNPLSNDKFTTSKIIVGTNDHVAPELSDIGLKGLLFPVVAKIHTHPQTPEIEHLKTTLPVDGDIQLFFNDNYSAMVVLDHGGVHLLIRTREPIDENPPPKDLIANLIREEATKEGLVANVQKKMNTALSRYGINYFYSDSPIPSVDETITFKKP